MNVTTIDLHKLSDRELMLVLLHDDMTTRRAARVIMFEREETSLWDKLRPKPNFVREADVANYTDEETDELFKDLLEDGQTNHSH